MGSGLDTVAVYCTNAPWLSDQFTGHIGSYLQICYDRWELKIYSCTKCNRCTLLSLKTDEGSININCTKQAIDLVQQETFNARDLIQDVHFSRHC